MIRLRNSKRRENIRKVTVPKGSIIFLKRYNLSQISIVIYICLCCVAVFFTKNYLQDEYEKKNEFYDEYHEDDEHEKHGDNDHHHDAHEGGHRDSKHDESGERQVNINFTVMFDSCGYSYLCLRLFYSPKKENVRNIIMAIIIISMTKRIRRCMKNINIITTTNL